MINAERIAEMKRLSEVVPPGPWTSGEGYEQAEPGYYFADVRGNIAFADEEGTVSPNTIQFIAKSRQFVPDIIAAYEKQAEEIDKLRMDLRCSSDVQTGVIKKQAEEIAKLRRTLIDIYGYTSDLAIVRTITRNHYDIPLEAE